MLFCIFWHSTRLDNNNNNNKYHHNNKYTRCKQKEITWKKQKFEKQQQKNTKYYIILVCTQINNTKYNKKPEKKWKELQAKVRCSTLVSFFSLSFFQAILARAATRFELKFRLSPRATTPSSILCLSIGSTKSKEMFKPAKIHTHKNESSNSVRAGDAAELEPRLQILKNTFLCLRAPKEKQTYKKDKTQK